MEHVGSDNVVSEGHVLSRDADANKLPRDVETLTEQLSEVRLEIEGLHNELTNQNVKLDELRSELEAAKQKLTAFDEMQGEAEALKKSLKQQTTKAKRFWTLKCEQLLAHEALIEEKDAEIATLKVLRSGIVSSASDVTADPDNIIVEASILSETSSQPWVTR